MVIKDAQGSVHKYRMVSNSYMKSSLKMTARSIIDYPQVIMGDGLILGKRSTVDIGYT